MEATQDEKKRFPAQIYSKIGFSGLFNTPNVWDRSTLISMTEQVMLEEPAQNVTDLFDGSNHEYSEQYTATYLRNNEYPMRRIHLSYVLDREHTPDGLADTYSSETAFTSSESFLLEGYFWTHGVADYDFSFWVDDELIWSSSDGYAVSPATVETLGIGILVESMSASQTALYEFEIIGLEGEFDSQSSFSIRSNWELETKPQSDYERFLMLESIDLIPIPELKYGSAILGIISLFLCFSRCRYVSRERSQFDTSS